VVPSGSEAAFKVESDLPVSAGNGDSYR